MTAVSLLESPDVLCPAESGGGNETYGFSAPTVGTILLSIFGLCLLPFLCFGDQYIVCADLVLAVDCLVWQRGRRSY